MSDPLASVETFLAARHEPDDQPSADIIATLPSPHDRGFVHLTGADLRALVAELEALRLQRDEDTRFVRDTTTAVARLMTSTVPNDETRQLACAVLDIGDHWLERVLELGER